MFANAFNHKATCFWLFSPLFLDHTYLCLHVACAFPRIPLNGKISFPSLPHKALPSSPSHSNQPFLSSTPCVTLILLHTPPLCVLDDGISQGELFLILILVEQVSGEGKMTDKNGGLVKAKKYIFIQPGIMCYLNRVCLVKIDQYVMHMHNIPSASTGKRVSNPNC